MRGLPGTQLSREHPSLRSPLFTLSWGKGRSRPRHSVRGLPGTQPTREHLPTGPLFFTLSEGRGRFGRPRPKPVRGLPGTQLSREHPSLRSPLFTLSWGRGRFGRPRPKPVRGLPVEISTRASTVGCNRIQAAPLFTLSEGRGRLGRPRAKPVRGLPGNQRRVLQRSPLREKAEPAPDAIRGSAYPPNPVRRSPGSPPTPSAPKPPVEAQPDQLLPTSPSDSHLSLLSAHSFFTASSSLSPFPTHSSPPTG